MGFYDHRVRGLDGSNVDLGQYRGNVSLVVNVASRCGLTPQYTALQALHERYAGRGFTVLGFPCNQFGKQEPGTSEEIARFCRVDYGVEFPVFGKSFVNGPLRSPVYAELVAAADDGYHGDVRWNFEKFLVDASGTPVARFAPQVEPDADAVVAAIEQRLPR